MEEEKKEFTAKNGSAVVPSETYCEQLLPGGMIMVPPYWNGHARLLSVVSAILALLCIAMPLATEMRRARGESRVLYICVCLLFTFCLRAVVVKKGPVLNKQGCLISIINEPDMLPFRAI